MNQTLKELGIDDVNPRLSDDEKQARVIDLLQSRSGVYHEAGSEAEVMMAERPPRGSHKPGTQFYYNNWDFNALGTVFEKATGEKIFSAFHENIARPLHMEQYAGTYVEVHHMRGAEDIPKTDGFYLYDEEKSVHPAYHFRMSASDLALFGSLYMHGGSWNGRQIIPAEWVEKSTQAYSVIDPQIGMGYGYMWNILPMDETLGRCFLHTGNGVHLLAIFPDIKLVMVHRVDTTRPYDFDTRRLFQLWDIFFRARI